MYSRKMFQSSKQRVLKVTWERCCDLAWKASRRSLHRDHTSVLARDVQGAKATPNRAKRAPGCTSEKKMTSSIAREFPMFRNISERVEDVRVHKREKIRVHKREKIRVHKRPPCPTEMGKKMWTHRTKGVGIWHMYLLNNVHIWMLVCQLANISICMLVYWLI